MADEPLMGRVEHALSLSIVHKLKYSWRAYMEATDPISIIFLTFPVKLVEGGIARRMPFVYTTCQQRLSCSCQALVC